MLEKLKLRLRLSSDVFDDQITDYVDECVAELVNQGVVNHEADDPLIISACELYCKYKFNFDEQGQWYFKRWEKLRDNISRMSAYTKEA